MKTTINQVILQLSCFFFIPFWVNAQSGLLLSLNGGLSNSKIRYTNLVNLKTTNTNILGYQGGVNVGWRFSKRFTLLSGFFIIQKGTKFAEENKPYQDYSNGGQLYWGSLTGEEKTSFYSVPIVGRFRIIGNRFGLLASTGLSFNKGRGGTAFKYVQANGGKVFAGRYEMIEFGDDIDQYYTPYQVGFIMGLSVQIPVNEHSRVLLNATTDIGMTDALNQRYKQANTIFEKAYSRSSLFSIGYEYHFSIKDLY